MSFIDINMNSNDFFFFQIYKLKHSSNVIFSDSFVNTCDGESICMHAFFCKRKLKIIIDGVHKFGSAVRTLEWLLEVIYSNVVDA